MTDRLRILLLDRNRYRAQLVGRMLTEVADSAVVARFESGSGAVRELQATCYDIAIMNIEQLDRPVDLVQAARLARRSMSLIVVGSKGTPRKVIAAIESITDCRPCWTDDPTVWPPPALRSAVATAGRTPTADEPVPAS